MKVTSRVVFGITMFAALGALVSPQVRQRKSRVEQGAEVPQETKSQVATLAPFRKLDRVQGASLDLMLAPVRPMLRHPANGRLYAVNSHNSTVVEFDSEYRAQPISVPWGPVALAAWESRRPTGDQLLLVVCRGSYVLTCIDINSNAIVGLIDLPAEPADIVVHPTSNRAFVSCSGAGCVVEIDLDAAQITNRYSIPAVRPTFLALDGHDVLVAPMLSGNNSIASASAVLDLEDPSVALQALKDNDLFRISSDGKVLPVASDMGAVLFAVGINPVSGEVWQLGTEAKNKDPRLRGEPELRGDFIINQLSIAQLDPAAVVLPMRSIDLDDSDPGQPGVQFDAGRSVGQPFGLAFDSLGRGYVTGQLSRNVTQLSPTGEFMREWNVGSIPRGILVDAKGEFALIYCWGSNQIEVYSLNDHTPTRIGLLDVGFDPTPDLERAGRELFFDSSNSLHGNASCASCHVETETDMLTWDLSDLPFDDKGPFVTQTMRGIGDKFPLHWRGERETLQDFNGAFDGLLGGVELDTSPGAAFDQFEAYINSLEQPANPGTHPDRMLDANADPAGGNAILGQSLFFGSNPMVDSCNACHSMPTGTSDEPRLGNSIKKGDDRRSHLVVPSFNGLWRKEQPTIETVLLANGTGSLRPTTGSGLQSRGDIESRAKFIQDFIQFDAQEHLDIAAFVAQMDSGLAPVVHRAWLLNQSTVASVGLELRDYLMPQASIGNTDIAVFGTLDHGFGAQSLGWFWDRTQGVFVSESSSIPTRSLEQFVSDSMDGKANLVFLGLPVGFAERFAVDTDADDLFNLDELRMHTNPRLSDSDGDGYPDGHEVKNGGVPNNPELTPVDTKAPLLSNLKLIFRTSKIAKLQFDSNEPSTVDATWNSSLESNSKTIPGFAKNHTLILQDLEYGTFYSVVLGVTDHAGNRTSVTLPGGFRSLRSNDGVGPILQRVSTVISKDSGGELHASITGQGHEKVGGSPVPRSSLMASIFVNGKLFQDVAGPRAGNDGFSTIDFELSGLSPGDEIRVVFNSLGVRPWNMPETEPENREHTIIYSGAGL